MHWELDYSQPQKVGNNFKSSVCFHIALLFFLSLKSITLQQGRGQKFGILKTGHLFS